MKILRFTSKSKYSSFTMKALQVEKINYSLDEINVEENFLAHDR